MKKIAYLTIPAFALFALPLAAQAAPLDMGKVVFQNEEVPAECQAIQDAAEKQKCIDEKKGQ